MKFIFPQNYNFKNKLFGIIEYSALFLNIFWYSFIFSILNFLFSNWNIKIFLLISSCFPITLFSFFGFNGESIVYVLKYVFKYFFRPKLYLYKKFFH